MKNLNADEGFEIRHASGEGFLKPNESKKRGSTNELVVVGS